MTKFFESFIGFDELERIFDHAGNVKRQTYPPYNIIKTGNNHIIEVAVAGFDISDISIVKDKNVLRVSGNKEKPENLEFIHRGIAARNFQLEFRLADDVVVKSAIIKLGILSISLDRVVKEEDKPISIPIETSEKQLLID